MVRLVPEKLFLTTLIVALFSLIPGSVSAATEVTVFLPINDQWDQELDEDGIVKNPCFLFYDVNLHTAIYQCSWEWTYPEEIKEIIPPIDDSTDRNEWQKKVLDILNEVEDTPIEELIEQQEQEPEPLPQWKVALEEKKQEIAEKYEQFEDLLKECEALKERWQHIQSSDYIDQLEISDSPFIIADYAKSGREGDINLMIEACRGMIKFQPQILQYENLIDSASEIVETTQTEEAHLAHEQKQDDLAQLKLDEAAFWLAWRCEPDQVKIGLCKEHLDETARDPNRGGFTYDEKGNVVGKDCSYYYIQPDRKKSPIKVEFCISGQQAEIDRVNVEPEDAQQTLCTEYMPHYSGTGSFPEFLSHCVGYLAEPLEEEIQTEQSCPDCDVETMTKEKGTRHCYEPGRGEVDCEKYDEDKAERNRDN